MAVVSRERGLGALPWRAMGWSTALVLLTAPLVAMQFTDEVKWTGFDFALFGAMLAAVGGGIEFAAYRSADRAYRGGAMLALATAFLLVLVNGAVGLIGSERDDANSLFGLVLAVALVGAVVARFRGAGMARAMLGAAAAQGATPLAIWAARLGSAQPVSAHDLLGSILPFVSLWLGAAWLFGRAARRERALGNAT